MKILYLSQYIYPLTTGGVGTHVHEIARRIKRIAGESVDITIIGGNQNKKYIVNYEIEGLKIRAFNSLVEKVKIPGLGTIVDGGLSLKPIILMIREAPDIVHFHGFSGSWLGLLAVLYCGLLRKPLVFTPHYHDIRKYRYHPLFYINRFIIKYSKRIIAVTQIEKDKITKLFNIKTNKVDIVYNGVDSNLLELNCLYDKYVLYVGQGLDKKKGFERALNLFMEIKNTGLYEEWRFIAVGNGVDQEKYKSIIPENIKNSIFLLGSVNRDKLVEFYRTCYMLILPSDYEAFGIVLAEAMACKKPVIAFKVGGVPEAIIDGVTGYTVSNIDEMKEKVIKLMRDKELTVRLGESGSKHVSDNFVWEKSAIKQYKIYEEILACVK